MFQLRPYLDRWRSQAQRLRIRRLLCWMGAGFLICSLIASIALYHFLKPYYLKAQTYDLSKLEDFDVTTVFYDRNGEEIGRLFVEDRILLKHDQIPDLMREAVIAVEDKRFYKHDGVDYFGLFRAFWANVKARATVQGGSTISQQLAKHLIGNFQKTLDRKLEEAFLAFRIEDYYSKDQILDNYLNRIYFGKGYFGIESAARGYFGKAARDLDLSECALLAGIIRAPSSRSPGNNLEKARFYRDAAIQKMRRLEFISEMEAAHALEKPISLVTTSTERPVGGIRSYFMALAVKELAQTLRLEEDDEIPQGLRVQTTFDSNLQRDAEKETLKKLQELESEITLRQFSAGPLETGPLQAAALVADLESGAIRVLIGGRDFQASPFDRATMARRENGALLHPFLYALAFEKLDLHPASLVNASFLEAADTTNPEEDAL
jgi:membrane peptidoglycan carboxypeptidase